MIPPVNLTTYKQKSETQHSRKRYRRCFCFFTKNHLRKENYHEKIKYASLRRLISPEHRLFFQA